MATFKICVFEHQKRQDGKYPVSIRVCWERKYGYIKTEFYVTDKQIVNKTIKANDEVIKKIFEVKDIYIINELNSRIARYEELKVKKLGVNIELYSAKELAEYFKKETTPGTDGSIDFVEFAKKYIENLESTGRGSTAKTLKTPINSLIDFCNGRTQIDITEITTKFLKEFELFLRRERTMKRKIRSGKIIETKSQGLSDVSIHDYMTAIRILFNAAIDEYNDEDRDEIRIKHYPFRKYKLQKIPESQKRNLTVEQIRAIANVPENKLIKHRNIIARDVFMLSFYLAGTNLVDLYNAKASSYYKGRFSYERQKTKSRRADKAFISIKVEPEAKPLFKQYRDKSCKMLFNFSSLFADHNIFNASINKGLKKVAAACGITEPLSSYYARFSFASIARNDCGISKDDIHEVLNHSDPSMRITDIYIKKDWSVIDNLVRGVIDRVM
jgi:integrase